ncbi:MAG: AAA family ATPase [Pseudomonadota bacterium]
MQQGDKRWAALLAMDIVGFSALTQKLGEETVYELLQDVLGIARDAVTTHEGHVVDVAGDGVLASFGAPTAVENASLLACRAAEQIRSELRAAAGRMLRAYGVAPQVRMGLGGGTVMVAHRAADDIKLVGDPVNIAARLQALAAPDTVLIGPTIAREVTGFVTTADPQDVKLKGYDEPMTTVRLVNVIDAASRFEVIRKRGLSAFVSRRAEFARATEIFAPHAANSSLLLSGVAGIGKSRLLFEVLAHVEGSRPAHVGQCASNLTGRAFAPLEQVIQRASGVAEEAGFAAQMAALRPTVPDCYDDAGLTRYLSPRDTEMDPVGRLLHDRAFMSSALTSIARRTDAVIVVEDVHWADTATVDVLKSLIAASVPLVMTSRNPEPIESMPALIHIALAPMADVEIVEIFADRAGLALSPNLQARVAKSAEGIPLIAEEMALVVAASDGLIETDAGLDLEDPDSVLFTGNLQQLVLSRVDRLPSEEKETLQIASAIGRDFAWPVVGAVMGQDVDPDPDRFDGIVEALDGRTGRFSHALIREAVYSGLLARQRQDIHRKIAEAIIAQSNAPRAAVLAEHYLAAEMLPEAAVALISAGDEAFQVYDMSQADQMFTQAFDLVQADPAVLSDADYVRLCDVWMRSRSVYGLYRKILEVSDDFLPRLGQVAYLPGVSIARSVVALALTGGRDYSGARDLLLETIALAEAEGDAYGAAWAKSTLARVYDETNWEGPEAARNLCAEILPVAEDTHDRLLAMTAHYLTFASYRACGMQNSAMAVSEKLEAMAEVYDDRRAAAYANWARGVLFSTLGEPEKSATYVAEGKKYVIPLTTDSRVLQWLEVFTEVYTHPPEDVRARVAALRAEAVELLDYNLIHSGDWIRTVLEFRTGRLAAGWRLTEQLKATFEEAGNANLVRQNLITRAEVVLTVLGLIDPDSEAPPDRPKFPRGKPKFADIAMFIRLKLFGTRIAQRDLEDYVALDPQKRGAHFARAQIGLGLIAAKRQQRDRAREHLNMGLRHARDESIEVLVARAEAGLATL